MGLINETQVSIKKCGILPYYHNFPVSTFVTSNKNIRNNFFLNQLFADDLEKIIGQNSPTARSVVDQAYHKLAICIISWLSTLGEHHHSPQNFTSSMNSGGNNSLSANQGNRLNSIKDTMKENPKFKKIVRLGKFWK